MDRNRSR